ncbi:MAG: Hsp70 family protein [Thermoanaerobaculia bacterium]
MKEIWRFWVPKPQAPDEKPGTSPESDGLPAEGLADVGDTPVAAAQAQDGDHQGRTPLRICIDLGTFASTVSRFGNDKIEFAVLQYLRDGQRRHEIESVAAWVKGRPVLGIENIFDAGFGHGTAEITGSFKRLLFEHGWFTRAEDRVRNQERLVELYRELLLLALAPDKSWTVQCLGEQTGGGDGNRERLDDWTDGPGLAMSRDAVTNSILAGAEIRICVPNALDAEAIDEAVTCMGTAFGKVLEDLLPLSVGEPPKPKITAIREAEAIAWASHDESNQLVLVLDAGAGTTDAALIEIKGRIPTVIQRTGVPFGGNDVDHLLLRTVHDEKEKLRALRQLEIRKRYTITQEVRKRKETWSDNMKGKLSDAERQGLSERLQRGSTETALPETPLFIPELIGEADVSGDIGTTGTGIQIAHPFGNERFLTFLQMTVFATCEPLLRSASERGGIRQVFLSGAASHTPGFREALELLLRQHGSEVPIHDAATLLDDVGDIDDVTPVRRSKFACGFGGARSMGLPGESIDRTLLPEDHAIVFIRGLGDTELDLFPAGTRVTDDELVAFFSLEPPAIGSISFYRYFTKPESIPKQHRKTPWVRRYLGRLMFDRGVNAIAIQLRQGDIATLGKDAMKVWLDRGEPRLMPRRLEPPAPPVPGHDISPVTGLPVEWLWYEERRH